MHSPHFNSNDGSIFLKLLALFFLILRQAQPHVYRIFSIFLCFPAASFFDLGLSSLIPRFFNLPLPDCIHPRSLTFHRPPKNHIGSYARRFTATSERVRPLLIQIFTRSTSPSTLAQPNARTATSTPSSSPHLRI